MTTHVNQIISLLIQEKCFQEIKDQNGQFDKRNHQYIFHVLNDLKTKNSLELQLHVLLPIKSNLGKNEELLQYFNALINAIHMDAIDKKLQSINSTCDLIYNQMFATAIKRGYQAEIASGAYNKNNPFVRDTTKTLERIKELISKLYPRMDNIDYISYQSNVIKNLFKRENTFNIIIERLSNSINNDAEKVIEYKKSLLKFE